MPFPDKKYNIIYADPPWRYEQTAVRGNVNDQYETMATDDIFKLPVKNIAADNCALLLWIVSPKLAEIFPAIFDSWGFDYKTIGFVWFKTPLPISPLATTVTTQRFLNGMGRYTRSNVELCFLGIKGTMEVRDRAVQQAHIAPVRGHSKKPYIIRQKIVQLFGDLPRIELFARQKTQGWDVWGNDVNNEIEQPTLLSYSTSHADQ